MRKTAKTPLRQPEDLLLDNLPRNSAQAQLHARHNRRVPSPQLHQVHRLRPVLRAKQNDGRVPCGAARSNIKPELARLCVQAALYERTLLRHNHSYGRFHEASRVDLPFCGFAWCGLDDEHKSLLSPGFRLSQSKWVFICVNKRNSFFRVQFYLTNLASKITLDCFIINIIYCTKFRKNC